MAIWQFQFYFIPAEWASKAKSNIESLFSEEGFDTSLAWKGYSSDLDVESIVQELLPLGKSWHKDLTVYGDLDTTDIQIWKRDKVVESIGVRLDLRQTSEKFLEQLINISKNLNFWLLFPELMLLEKPDLNILITKIRESNAARFVNNPEKFLRQANET